MFGYGEYAISVALSVFAAAFYQFLGRLFNSPELIRRQAVANQEIVLMLLPLIPNKELPSAESLAGYVISTAGRHQVNPGSLITIDQICNSLIRATLKSVLVDASHRNRLVKEIIEWRSRIRVDFKKLMPRASLVESSPQLWRSIAFGMLSFQTSFVIVFDWSRSGGTNRLFTAPMAWAPLFVVLFVPVVIFLVRGALRLVMDRIGLASGSDFSESSPKEEPQSGPEEKPRVG